MFVRILTVGLCLVLALGCAKKRAKDDSPSPDETAGAPARPQAAPADKGEKQEEPNWLGDDRFKTKPPGTPADGSSPGKQPWGLTPPQGGWQGPNAGVQPVKPPGEGVLQPMPVPPNPPAAVTPSPAPAYKPVSAADMREVWVYIENTSGASGRMPTQLMIYQALVAAESPAAGLVKNGSIYLTGATARDSVWAFEARAVTSGGLVASQNGVETLTAAQLKQRLGK